MQHLQRWFAPKNSCVNYFITHLMTAVFAASSAMILPQPLHPPTIGRTSITKFIESPHIAYTSNDNTEIFIIGTSHFSSNSADEVKDLISAVKPDGVVLELDPERCLRLTKQSCGFDASGAQTDSGDVVYGADFLSAINACQELDIPLFLGDEYAQETRERLLPSFGDLDAYSPESLVQSLFPEPSVHSHSNQSRIDSIETFRQDPQKLTPLVVTTSPPFILASTFSLFSNQHTAIAYDGIDRIASLFGSFFELGAVIVGSVLLSSLLFNNIIVERDRILANSTIKAIDVLRSLKNGRSIRKRWKFQASTQELRDMSAKVQLDKAEARFLRNVPLFTLKTPIQKGIVRNLNLFEPRWLKMMDQLVGKSCSAEHTRLGCVLCTNKFYSAIEIDGREGRYADIIFDTIGNLAEIVDLKEGKRPVSGDRRLSVTLRGGESFVVDDSNLKVCNDGYMMASAVEPQCLEHVFSTQNNSEDNDHKVRVVVVVGLLHGNGVLALLSKSDF